ncbi:MAG: hypothetical protein SYC29_13965 [Planctomycetota bacterium]|nr:hypothetical protein [Planctomycetota bacterium]
MAKRSGRTPLYELIKRRGDPAERRAEPPRPGEAPPDEENRRWLAPGRTIRVPIGYLLLALAGVLLLLAIVYMLGYWRGGQDTRAEYDARYLESRAGGDAARRARDPLTEPGAEETGADAARPASPSAAPEDGGAPADDSRADETGLTRPRSAWGPVESDPRRAGRWYLVLAETQPEGARRLAAYCREAGLEAYVVVSHNNPARRCVIVLPGLASDAMSDPRERPLREQVYRVGDAWQATHRGERNLRDAYLHLYEG